MRRYLCAPLVVAAALSSSSCGSDDEAAPAAVVAPAATAPLAAADQAIAATLYAGTARTPPGFLADPAPPSYSEVTTYHLKSSQLEAPAAISHELCTDDWSVAFAWSEEAAAQASPYLDFVSNEATTGYFEFARIPRGEHDRYVRMRVYRCSYLDRDAVNLAAANGPAGRLNHRPVDAATLREISEYLWQFSAYNNANHAVIASQPLATGLGHALTIASLERAASAAMCDSVTVRDWVHTVDPSTGSLQLETTLLREFSVRLQGGAPVGC
jgi:hypothetical protein